MLMIRLVYAAAFAFLAPLHAVIASQKECVDDVASARYCLTVDLSSGAKVRNVIYKKEPLGGKWQLQIKKSAGLEIINGSGYSSAKLNHDEFEELLRKVFEILSVKFDGKLDSLQLSVALDDDVWKRAVEHMRSYGMPAAHRVQAKDVLLTSALYEFLDSSSEVQTACDAVGALNLACGKDRLSYNPVVFRDNCYESPWGEVRESSDIGIDTLRTWYSIKFVAAR